MFKDTKNPTMAELVNYFQINFTELCNTMKASNHAAVDNEPNPYHLEDDVWAHTMMVALQAQNSSKVNKIAALLHDTGKPLSREVIPFNKPKPTHTPSNELREADKENSKTEALQRETKTHFRGHEGISFYKATDVLKKLMEDNVVNSLEVQEILTIISLHGTLFDSIRDGAEFKPEKVAKKWHNRQETFEKFVDQVRFDSMGRFSPSQDARSATGSALGTKIYGPQFSNTLMDEDFHKTKIIPSQNITVLVGVPLSGKSTWMAENVGEEEVVISRDATLVEFGQLKYGSPTKGDPKLTYSEIWKLFTEDDHKQVDRMVRSQYEIAVKTKRNIYIDMTNTSKKSRGKWLNNLKGYHKRAVIFATGYEEILRRNTKRYEETGKFIPEGVITNMMKAFMVPMGDEVDHTSWVHDFS